MTQEIGRKRPGEGDEQPSQRLRIAQEQDRIYRAAFGLLRSLDETAALAPFPAVTYQPSDVPPPPPFAIVADNDDDGVVMEGFAEPPGAVEVISSVKDGIKKCKMATGPRSIQACLDQIEKMLQTDPHHEDLIACKILLLDRRLSEDEEALAARQGFSDQLKNCTSTFAILVKARIDHQLGRYEIEKLKTLLERVPEREDQVYFLYFYSLAFRKQEKYKNAVYYFRKCEVAIRSLSAFKTLSAQLNDLLKEVQWHKAYCLRKAALKEEVAEKQKSLVGRALWQLKKQPKEPSFQILQLYLKFEKRYGKDFAKNMRLRGKIQETLTAITRFVPGDVYSLRKMGSLYLQMQEPRKAEEKFNAALKIDPKNKYVLSRLEKIHTQTR